MFKFRQVQQKNFQLMRQVIFQDAFKLNQNRGYFTMMDKIRDKIQKPYRHIQSLIEPDGLSNQTQLPETYRMHGNTAMAFTAHLTGNAFDMNQWHEMDNTVHSQFGTIDNPVLIFTSDSSWRVVICQGPGVEDDSHQHEKMFYYVREGPIHRCQVCGQCFKIVRLKDEYSELNDYYSTMFTQLNHFEISEEDMHIHMNTWFSDRPMMNMQQVPSNHVYIQVNSDEADRILIDPAYKLERLKEAHEKLYALHQSYKEVEKQINEQCITFQIPYGKDLFETWYKIEKSIRKFDRIFNRVEKFNKRKYSQPEHHERREKRMLDRKRERWAQNYTYFFGNLTEEEQMYRDYFETDLEMVPENEMVEDFDDDLYLAAEEQFQFRKYDFIETSLELEAHETYEDIVEQKIFKYKYKQFNDDIDTYLRRLRRMVTRFFERSYKRDPKLEQNIHDLFEKDGFDTSIALLMTEPEKAGKIGENELRIFREYIAEEATQQYMDYYESDEEEQKFFQHMKYNLSNREKIRFMEVFKDYTVIYSDLKDFISIPKREYNPQLSVFSNFALDLVDFKDRVRPLAKDIALLDNSRKYQKYNPADIQRAQQELEKRVAEESDTKKIVQ